MSRSQKQVNSQTSSTMRATSKGRRQDVSKRSAWWKEGLLREIEGQGRRRVCVLCVFGEDLVQLFLFLFSVALINYVIWSGESGHRKLNSATSTIFFHSYCAGVHLFLDAVDLCSWRFIVLSTIFSGASRT